MKYELLSMIYDLRMIREILRKKGKKFLWLLLLVLTAGFSYWWKEVKAAADLTEAAMRLDRMAASTTDVDILVLAKPASVATEAQVYLTFAAEFTVDGSPANIISGTAGLPATFNGEAVTAWLGLGTTALAVSGQNVTIVSGDLTAATLYGFWITAGVDNPAAAATYINTIATRTSGDAVIDSKRVAVDIVTAGSDLVTVTASVPPSFNFALDGNTVAFGDLSSSAITVGSTINIDVDTNATTGWTAWLASTNTSLDSASTADVIETSGTVEGTPTELTVSNDFYQLDVEVTNGTGGGTPAVAAEYDGGHSGTFTGGTFSSTLTSIATSTGPGTNDAVALFAMASIDATQKAASDYTDTWTIVGAANF